MIEAVIFDMDGVLIDSEPMHFKVDMEVLQLFNIKVKSSDLNKYVGTTNENMWKELKREYNIKYSVKEVIAAKNAKMKCIGFRNLNSGVQDLSQADIVVESIENIEVDNII